MGPVASYARDIRGRLRAALSGPLVLLLQGFGTGNNAAGIYWRGATRVAQARLLLRPNRRHFYSGRRRRHCPAAEELLHARYGHAHRSRPTRLASTVEQQPTAGITSPEAERVLAAWRFPARAGRLARIGYSRSAAASRGANAPGPLATPDMINPAG